MPDIKQRAHKLFRERFAPNGFIEEDEELVVPKMESFIDEIIDIAVAEERERVWKEKPLVI